MYSHSIKQDHVTKDGACLIIIYWVSKLLAVKKCMYWITQGQHRFENHA